MIRTLKIYTADPITLGQLREFVEEAIVNLTAPLDTVVRIRQAPTSNHPTDRGGEVTIEVSVDS